MAYLRLSSQEKLLEIVSSFNDLHFVPLPSLPFSDSALLPVSRPHLQMPPSLSQINLPFDQAHPQ